MCLCATVYQHASVCVYVKDKDNKDINRIRIYNI